MENLKSTNNEIFELLLRDALIERYKNEVQTAREHTTPHNFSAEFEKNIKKTARSIGRTDNIKTIGRSALKFVTVCASVMCILFGALLTQPKVYAAVQDVIRDVFLTHDKYTYQGNNENISFDAKMELGYIPDGYELRIGFYSASNVSLIYESLDEKYIYFDYGLADNSAVMIDNENSVYSELRHNDINFYFYETSDLENDTNSILWYSGGYYFSINAQLPQEEIIRIAENIKC